MVNLSLSSIKALRFRIGSRFFVLPVLLFCLMFAALETAAQETDELPKGVVPPPLSTVSQDEKEKLDEEESAAKRTKLAIAFMDNRLVQSKTFADDEKFQDSLDQLGRFTGLMNAMLKDLERNGYGRKSLKNNKKFEMALRKFIPRLELVRRSLPFSHSFHVAKLIKAVRDARRESIEPFFDDTVLPDEI